MANKFRGEADLNFTRMIDGKEKDAKFKLVFDANAFCEIEDLTGMNMGELLKAMQSPETLGFRSVRAIVLGGLLANHPELKLADAGDIISDAGLEDTMDALKDAFIGAMKSKDGAPLGEAPATSRRQKS